MKFDRRTNPTELIRAALLIGIFAGVCGADSSHALSAKIAFISVGLYFGVMYVVMIRWNWLVTPTRENPPAQEPHP